MSLLRDDVIQLERARISSRSQRWFEIVGELYSHHDIDMAVRAMYDAEPIKVLTRLNSKLCVELYMVVEIQTIHNAPQVRVTLRRVQQGPADEVPAEDEDEDDDD